jgi:hypothetical protein
MFSIFKPDYERYEGVRPINIYLLRLLFAPRNLCAARA